MSDDRDHLIDKLEDARESRDAAIVRAERAEAQAATLREWIEHASDFLDEIWIEYQSGSAVYEGASRLLHSGLPLLADTAAAAIAHDNEVVERCARLMAGYLSGMPGNTDKHPEDLLPESMRVLKQGVTPWAT